MEPGDNAGSILLLFFHAARYPLNNMVYYFLFAQMEDYFVTNYSFSKKTTWRHH
jgi:hypothetical protein